MAERERGFTLIEVLVALAVLGLVLTAVFRIYGTGVLNVGHGVDELRLALAAEAILERTRLDLDPRLGSVDGTLEDGISWRMQARPLPPPPPLPRAGRQRSLLESSLARSPGQDGKGEQEPTGPSAVMPGGSGFGAPGNLAQQRPRLWEVHVTVAAAGRSFELATLQWLAPR